MLTSWNWTTLAKNIFYKKIIRGNVCMKIKTQIDCYFKTYSNVDIIMPLPSSQGFHYLFTIMAEGTITWRPRQVKTLSRCWGEPSQYTEIIPVPYTEHQKNTHRRRHHWATAVIVVVHHHGRPSKHPEATSVQNMADAEGSCVVISRDRVLRVCRLICFRIIYYLAQKIYSQLIGEIRIGQTSR